MASVDWSRPYVVKANIETVNCNLYRNIVAYYVVSVTENCENTIMFSKLFKWFLNLLSNQLERKALLGNDAK